MEKLLERALEDLDAAFERRWDDLFSRPPSETLERMAAEALEDFRSGRTTPLDPDHL
jgi:hypothetical protein